MTVNPWRPEAGSIASIGEFANKMVKNFDDTVLKGFADVLFPLNTLAARSKAPYPAAYRNYFQIAATLRANTPEKTIIACRKSGLFYVMGARKVVGYRFSLDPLEVIQGLVDDRVDYVIVDQLGYSSTSRYLVPAIQRHPALFNNRLTLPNPNTYLLQFDRNKAVSMLSNGNIEGQ